METIYWHLENEMLWETPTIDPPSDDDPHYGHHRDGLRHFKEDMRKYAAYLASLRSIPCLPNSEWKKKEKMVEGKDFKIQEKDTQLQSTTGEWLREYETHTYAVPILPTPETFTVTREMLEKALGDMWEYRMHYLLDSTGKVAGKDACIQSTMDQLTKKQ